MGTRELKDIKNRYGKEKLVKNGKQFYDIETKGKLVFENKKGQYYVTNGHLYLLNINKLSIEEVKRLGDLRFGKY